VKPSIIYPNIYGRSHPAPSDDVVCTTYVTNYQWGQSYHLQALDLFALAVIALLSVMLWRKYRREHR
jgi:hypothetical protein